ncbi:MAG: hypothetical protein LHW48_10630 [Candidatus Cloacimonetes bacterium]|nr:hypothetical protein [Candidatus Cloacimonadota bacterium]
MPPSIARLHLCIDIGVIRADFVAKTQQKIGTVELNTQLDEKYPVKSIKRNRQIGGKI